MADTPAEMLVSTPKAPAKFMLDGQAMDSFTHEPENQILRIRFTNTSAPRDLSVEF